MTQKSREAEQRLGVLKEISGDHLHSSSGEFINWSVLPTFGSCFSSLSTQMEINLGWGTDEVSDQDMHTSNACAVFLAKGAQHHLLAEPGKVTPLLPHSVNSRAAWRSTWNRSLLWEASTLSTWHSSTEKKEPVNLELYLKTSPIWKKIQSPEKIQDW